MPFNITLLRSCLIVVSAAVAAERPACGAPEPWWSNPPSSTSSATGPKITEYGAATATGSDSKAAESRPADHLGQAAEFAPDPPGPRHSDTLPATFLEESGPAAETPKAGASPEKAGTRKSARDPQAGAPDDTPPLQLPATAPAAPPLPLSKADAPPSATRDPQALTSVPRYAASDSLPSAQGDFAAALGLGSHNDKNGPGKKSPLSAMITVGGSLAIVLGLFFVVAWVLRKTAPRGSLVLPKEVFEILGRAPLGARQQVQLLRCGNKLLLVSITPNGTETLTEVTDPLEVDRIAGVCQQSHPKSTTVAFRQVFQQLATGAPSTPGRGEPAELDNLELAGRGRKRYRWEERNA